MPDGEVPASEDVVRNLLRQQTPQWAHLPLRRVEEVGTDNVLYRLGDSLVVRLPRGGRSVASLLKECEWLPRLRPHLPVAIPQVLAVGRPDARYPHAWAVYEWLHGERATESRVHDQMRLVRDLAEFVSALWGLDSAGAPAPGDHNFHRGVPLADRDDETRSSIAALGGRLDTAAVTDVWEQALAAPAWSGPPVWIHGDLDRQNLLVRDGRLSGVIDFGGLGAGDPACDVMAAWKLFDADARAGFRATLDVDEATWQRSRGWVVSQAVMALAYYTDETHPVLVRESRRWISSAVAD
ncbi:MAG TPA: aminoglycoside phosphotransferase family protein [Gaiellales bacterium]|nr:aminoglycoside phosphotransferase family protein [Gaiellales bacterium]